MMIAAKDDECQKKHGAGGTEMWDLAQISLASSPQPS
jgi:hypothetical protein